MRKNPISEDLKAFYEYHSILMEPWDGPATLLFSDGRYAGGMLDRNGLRPARYLITQNDMMVIASEAGVLAFDAADIKEKGRLQPGKLLLVDTEKGAVYHDQELKEQLAGAYPYREWLSKNRVKLDTISSGRTVRHDVPDYSASLCTPSVFIKKMSSALSCPWPPTARNPSPRWVMTRRWPSSLRSHSCCSTISVSSLPR